MARSFFFLEREVFCRLVSGRRSIFRGKRLERITFFHLRKIESWSLLVIDTYSPKSLHLSCYRLRHESFEEQLSELGLSLKYACMYLCSCGLR